MGHIKEFVSKMLASMRLTACCENNMAYYAIQTPYLTVDLVQHKLRIMLNLHYDQVSNKVEINKTGSFSSISF